MNARVRPADAAGIAAAAAALRVGGLVVIPTETVYGLAADARDPAAIARLYAAKGRPRFNPLIAHVADFSEAARHAILPPAAEALADAFWPGPLTLVAARRTQSAIAPLACAGLDSVALRAPAHPAAQALLKEVGFPLAAPSANRSGGVSPTTAEHAAADLGALVDLVLDGGACAIGVESTIVAFEPDRPAMLLRAGGVPRAAIEAIAGPLADAAPGEAPRAPGMLQSHYAPRATLRLNAVSAAPHEVYLGFGDRGIQGDLNLSPRGDMVEAAANLYAFLRALDADGARTIAVAPIPDHGLGEAINDRLARAAAPRP